MLLEEER